MRIAVFGATGRTGLPLCEQALERGHDVVAHTRSPDRLSFDDDRLTVVEGDAYAGTGVSEAIGGADAVVSVLGQGKSSPDDLLTVAGGILAGAVFLGQRVVDGVLARLPEDDARGHLVVVVAAAIGGSALTYAVGIEPALGAFVVGLLFARAGGVPERARATFERVTLGVFAPVFFGVAGLNADLGLLFDPVVAIVGTATLAVATVGKIGGVYLAASWLGYDRAEAVGMGIGLNARGAIEIVIATVGLELEILSPRMYTVVLIVAVVTSAMTPPLLRRVLGDLRPERIPGSVR